MAKKGFKGFGWIGTPWHIEYPKWMKTTTTTIKNNCKYYDCIIEFCLKYRDYCTGASHCKSYKELCQENTKNKQSELSFGKKIYNNNKQAKRYKIRKKLKIYIDEKDQVNLQGTKENFPIGCKVKHTIYGSGKVIKVNNERVTVKFNNTNKTITFVLENIVASKSIEKEN